MSKCYSIENDKVSLRILLQPGAKKNEIVGIHDNYLKVKIKAPAQEGKANAALIKFLASEFDVTSHDVILVKGKQSRYKQVTVCNVSKPPSWLLEL